jgi:hypothetical protein
MFVRLQPTYRLEELLNEFTNQELVNRTPCFPSHHQPRQATYARRLSSDECSSSIFDALRCATARQPCATSNQQRFNLRHPRQDALSSPSTRRASYRTFCNGDTGGDIRWNANDLVGIMYFRAFIESLTVVTLIAVIISLTGRRWKCFAPG